ncbi:MAG: aminoglycoside phosphotransferase family protein [Cyanobacteria bacterium]|nr:aminoglycoside phosphotransferase family protein [Cyanobacteriota bacterium]
MFGEIPTAISRLPGLKSSSIKAVKVTEWSRIFFAETEERPVIIKGQEVGRGSLDRQWTREIYEFLARSEFRSYAQPFPHGTLEEIVDDGLLWTVFDFIYSDEQFDWLSGGWNGRHCRELGSLLSSLHSVGAGDLERRQSRLLESFDLFPGESNFATYLMNGMDSLVARFELVLEKTFLEKLCRGYAECVESIKAIKGIRGSRQLENIFLGRTVVHGDVHFGNVRFQSGTAKALIDFDYAHVNRPAYDLGYALCSAARSFGESADVSSSGATRTTILAQVLERNIDPPEHILKVLDLGLSTELLSGYLEGLRCEQSTSELLDLVTPYCRLAGFLVFAWLIGELRPAETAEQPDTEFARQVCTIASCLRLMGAYVASGR